MHRLNAEEEASEPAGCEGGGSTGAATGAPTSLPALDDLLSGLPTAIAYLRVGARAAEARLMSGMAALCISQGLPYFAIPFGVMTLLIVTYFCCVTNKIDLASQCLRTACKIVRAYPSTQLVALVM